MGRVLSTEIACFATESDFTAVCGGFLGGMPAVKPDAVARSATRMRSRMCLFDVFGCAWNNSDELFVEIEPPTKFEVSG